MVTSRVARCDPAACPQLGARAGTLAEGKGPASVSARCKAARVRPEAGIIPQATASLSARMSRF